MNLKCKNCKRTLPNESFFVEKRTKCVWCSVSYHYKKLKNKNNPGYYRKIMYNIIDAMTFERTNKNYTKVTILKIKEILCED